MLLLVVATTGGFLSVGQLRSKIICPHLFKVLPLCISTGNILYLVVFLEVSMCVTSVYAPVVVPGDSVHTEKGAKWMVQLTLMQIVEADQLQLSQHLLLSVDDSGNFLLIPVDIYI